MFQVAGGLDISSLQAMPMNPLAFVGFADELGMTTPYGVSDEHLSRGE